MATAANRYEPDHAVPPGWVLKERLDAQGMSATELARRCGRSAKLISEILAGKAPVEPKTALQFEKVLGVAAGIWGRGIRYGLPKYEFALLHVDLLGLVSRREPGFRHDPVAGVVGPQRTVLEGRRW